MNDQDRGTEPLELTPSHHASVGRIDVRRALPQRRHRTVGAWCFADHMGPANVTKQRGLDIGPHPHAGLQTVTWLIDGEALHRDSLGSEQLITPGQLNLMTAGLGVSHAEEGTGRYDGRLQGIQLWIAQPESTRSRPAAFEHHADLPMAEIEGGVATVLVGEFAALRSPARHDSELVGVSLSLSAPLTLPLQLNFEHALIALEGAVSIGTQLLIPGNLGYLPIGFDEARLEVLEPSRIILLGGVPFPEPILMWWNFVARSRTEIDAAFASWKSPDGRFGEVASSLLRIETPAPFWQKG